MMTKQQKEDLFKKIILDNAPNKFVYNQMRQTLMDNPNMVVPFVGAGLSQFSYKAWGALLQDLLDQLADQSIDMSQRSEIQKLIQCGDFFRAADLLENLIESDVFFFSLVSACNESKLIKEGIPEDAAVRWLPKVFTDSRIITTNYDCVLEMAYAQEKKYLRVCTPSDSRMFMQFMPRRLFKIHGSYDSNYEDIVLTSKSYEEKYAKGSLLYNNFKHIVQSSILFFLGASLRSDKTLDILKEIACELSVGGHYCGNMHYAIIHIDNGDKIRRRQELAEYKILPILYSEEDVVGIEDKHAIVGIILEKLHEEVTKQYIGKTPLINKDNLKASDELVSNIDTSTVQNSRMDNELIAQLLKQDPLKAFTYALSQKNLALAEAMLNNLERAIPKEVYLTKILPALSSRGSSNATKRLFDSLDEFLSGQYSIAQIIDVAGSIISYCNQQDKELEYLDVISELLKKIIDDASPHEKASICNQLARLYYGAFVADEQKVDYRNLAKHYSEQSISLNDTEPSYYYNLAVIQEGYDDISALDAMKKCLERGTDDIEHLSLAYRLYNKQGDSDAEKVIEEIQNKNPIIARMLTMDTEEKGKG